MLKRKDRILISAIELLDEEGVNGITTKNLAARQNVTEPALYRQYKGKQEIIYHIVEEYSSYDSKIINTIEQSEIKGLKAVEFYVQRFAELYQSYHELATILLSFDLYMYDDKTKALMQQVMNHRIEFLGKLVKESPEDFKVLAYKSAEDIASLIEGVIYSQVYQWKLAERSYRLNEKLVDMVMNLLKV